MQFIDGLQHAHWHESGDRHRHRHRLRSPDRALGSAADQAVLDTITVGTAASGIAPTITLPTTPVSVSITSRKILTPGGGR